MAEQFEGRPITDGNLSEWRAGGYEEWLTLDSFLNETRVISENAGQVAATGITSDQLRIVLLAHHAAFEEPGDHAGKGIQGEAQHRLQAHGLHYEDARGRIATARWNSSVNASNPSAKRKHEVASRSYRERCWRWSRKGPSIQNHASTSTNSARPVSVPATPAPTSSHPETRPYAKSSRDGHSGLPSLRSRRPKSQQPSVGFSRNCWIPVSSCRSCWIGWIRSGPVAQASSLRKSRCAPESAA